MMINFTIHKMILISWLKEYNTCNNMKVALCNLTVGEPYIKLVYYGHKSMVKYCEKNDYPLYYETELIDKNRHVYWNKILLIQKHLEKCDVMVWVDSDIMFINMAKKMEDIIENYMNDKDFMLCIDNGLWINTGVWFCRNTPFVMNMLTKIYEQRQFEDSKMPEQEAFKYLWDNNVDGLKDKSEILPVYMQSIFNSSIYNTQPDSLLLHFLGVHNPEWLTTLMNDHYPFNLDHEQDHHYYRRIRFINKKYGFNIPYMKIGVCCLQTGKEFRELMKLGDNTRIEYCKKNGYDYIDDDSVLDKDRHPAWSKILLAKKYLKSYDYLWVVDADTMIFNQDIKLEDYICEHMFDKKIMACRDVSGKINTGSVFFKNTYYTMKILDLIYEQTQYIDDKTWEQEAFNYLYENDSEKLKDNCSILPTHMQTLFNCPVGLFKPDIFMIHFYGPRDSKWVNKCMRDFYPKQRDDENEHMFNWRKDWYNKFK